jgi:hypothetical protein
MSIENRPNLHAIGLLTDIFTALEGRIRGKAKTAGFAFVLPLLSEDIQDFVEKVNTILDDTFGGSQ